MQRWHRRKAIFSCRDGPQDGSHLLHCTTHSHYHRAPSGNHSKKIHFLNHHPLHCSRFALLFPPIGLLFIFCSQHVFPPNLLFSSRSEAQAVQSKVMGQAAERNWEI